MVQFFKQGNIYLTLDELKEIQLLDLSGEPSLSNVCDLFLVGCYTGLRFSDFSRSSLKNITDNYITIQQSKTGGEVVIPVHKVVREIILKHDGLPHSLSNQKFNFYLKELCKKIPLFKIRVSKKMTKAGKEVTLHLEKWEMISTHTARRSFATNEYLNGTPSITIMAITGHKTERAFLKYIKVTAKEHAEKMKSLWEKRELKPSQYKSETYLISMLISKNVLFPLSSSPASAGRSHVFFLFEEGNFLLVPAGAQFISKGFLLMPSIRGNVLRSDLFGWSFQS